MSVTITIQDITDRKACREDSLLFVRRFGNSVTIYDLEHAMKLAEGIDFDYEWAAENLLHPNRISLYKYRLEYFKYSKEVVDKMTWSFPNGLKSLQMGTIRHNREVLSLAQAFAFAHALMASDAEINEHMVTLRAKHKEELFL